MEQEITMPKMAAWLVGHGSPMNQCADTARLDALREREILMMARCGRTGLTMRRPN